MDGWTESENGATSASCAGARAELGNTNVVYSIITLVLTIWEGGSCVFISNISYIVVMQDHRKCLEGLGNNFIFSEILILGDKVAISRL